MLQHLYVEEYTIHFSLRGLSASGMITCVHYIGVQDFSIVPLGSQMY